jgi:hypothetical protein
MANDELVAELEKFNSRYIYMNSTLPLLVIRTGFSAKLFKPRLVTCENSLSLNLSSTVGLVLLILPICKENEQAHCA